MLRLGCLILIYSVNLAFAQFDSQCFRALFKAGGESLSTEDVVTSYLSLFEKLGDGKIGPDVLKKIQEGGDPFAIPREVNLPSNTLRDALHDFRNLLTEHFGGEIPITKDLLDSLGASAGKKVKQAARQQGTDKKTDLKKLVTYSWDKPTREVFKVGDWYVAAGSSEYIDKKGWTERNVVDLIHTSGRKISIPFDKESGEKLVVPVVNPATGELYFSDRRRGNLWVMTLFDEKGEPLKKAKTEKLPLPADEKNGISVDDMQFSGDGRYLLLIDDRKGAFFSDFLGGAANGKLDFQGLGEVMTGGMEQNFGHFGNGKVYFRKDSKGPISIFDGTTQKRVELPQRGWFHSMSGSADGKHAYVMYYPLGEKPFVEVWNLEERAKNPNAQPVKWDLGHRDAVEDWEKGYYDEIVPLPDSKLVAHLYIGRKSQQGIYELRIEDPDTKKVLLAEPVKLPKGERVTELTLTPDGKAIQGTSEEPSKSAAKIKRTWQWNLEALMERIGN